MSLYQEIAAGVEELLAHIAYQDNAADALRVEVGVRGVQYDVLYQFTIEMVADSEYGGDQVTPDEAAYERAAKIIANAVIRPTPVQPVAPGPVSETREDAGC